jgi:hypothetical protein
MLLVCLHFHDVSKDCFRVAFDTDNARKYESSTIRKSFLLVQELKLKQGLLPYNSRLELQVSCTGASHTGKTSARNHGHDTKLLLGI